MCVCVGGPRVMHYFYQKYCELCDQIRLASYLSRHQTQCFNKLISVSTLVVEEV